MPRFKRSLEQKLGEYKPSKPKNNNTLITPCECNEQDCACRNLCVKKSRLYSFFGGTLRLCDSCKIHLSVKYPNAVKEKSLR